MGTIFSSYNENVGEDYLKGVKYTVYDESTSIIESALSFINEMNEDWNTTIREMALKELAVLESTGEEIVYEAFDAAGFIQKIKDFFTTLWANVAGLFKKCFDTVDAFIRDNKKFVEKYKVSFIDGSRHMPADGIKIKGYKFTGLDSATNNIKDAINEIDKTSTFDQLLNATGLKDASDNAYESYATFVKDTKTNMAEYQKTVLKLLGDKEGSVKSFNANLKKYYFGEELTVIKTVNADKVLKEVEAAYETRKAMKDLYATFKNDINKQIKTVNGWKKGLEKDDKLRSAKMAIINAQLEPLRFNKQKTAVAIGIILQAMNTKLRQDKEVIKRVSKFATEGKKVQPEETVNSESSTYDFETSVFGLDGLL